MKIDITERTIFFFGMVVKAVENGLSFATNAEVNTTTAPDWSILGENVVWSEQRDREPHGIFGQKNKFVRYAAVSRISGSNRLLLSCKLLGHNFNLLCTVVLSFVSA